MSAPSGYNITQTPSMSPETLKMYQSMVGGMGGMQDVMKMLTGLASGEGDAFAPMEQRAQQDFQKMLGGTASKFSQFGARGSSAFEQAATSGAADVATKLGEQRTALQMDAINKLLGFSGQILGAKPFETQLQEEDQGLDLQALAAAGIKSLPDLLKLFMGK